MFLYNNQCTSINNPHTFINQLSKEIDISAVN